MKCRNCPYVTGNRLDRSVQFVKLDVDLLLLSDYPTKNECEANKVFIGNNPTKRALKRYGAQELSIYSTSVLKCFPTQKDKSLLKLAIDGCKSNLKQEIWIANPKVILCIGHLSAAPLLDEDWGYGIGSIIDYRLVGNKAIKIIIIPLNAKGFRESRMWVSGFMSAIELAKQPRERLKSDN